MATTTMGDRLRQLRCIAGVEQKELAPILGFKTATGVSYLESGQRKIRGEHIDRAAIFFGNKLGETREEVIAFLYGSRRWRLIAEPTLVFDSAAETIPSKEEEKAISSSPGEASNGYFPLIPSDLPIREAEAA